MRTRRLSLVVLLSLAVAMPTGCGASTGTLAGRAEVGPGPESVAASSAAGEPSATVSAPRVIPTSAEPTPVVAPQLVFHGDRSTKRIALTFDLCEVPSKPSGFDGKLVDELIARQVPATFFMGGHWAETHAEEAKLVGGITFFEVGNHSYAHKHPLKITPSAFEVEISAAQEAILKATGRTPRVFRFPYGENGPRRLKQVADAGLVPVQWNVETGDPDPNVSASAILREVKRSAGNGAIVIMHGNGRGWHTAEALPGIVDWLESEGYDLVTVSELLGVE